MTRLEDAQLKLRKAVYAEIKAGHWCLQARRDIFEDPEFMNPFREWLRATDRTKQLELFEPGADDDLQTIEKAKREAAALGYPDFFEELDSVVPGQLSLCQVLTPTRTVKPEDIIPEPPQFDDAPSVDGTPEFGDEAEPGAEIFDPGSAPEPSVQSSGSSATSGAGDE